VAIQPDRLPEAAPYSVSLHCLASLTGNENPEFEFLSRLPDKGKKIGRNAASMLKKRVDLGPSSET